MYPSVRRCVRVSAMALALIVLLGSPHLFAQEGLGWWTCYDCEDRGDCSGVCGCCAHCDPHDCRTMGPGYCMTCHMDDEWVSAQGNFFPEKSQYSAEPVATSNGAYYFSIPLLDLGGPMGLSFTLFYRSDLGFPTKSPYDFGIMSSFAFGPCPKADLWEDSYHFWLEDYATVTFKKVGTEWVIDASDDFLPDNGQPIAYKIEELNDYVYLMNPMNQRIYIFHVFQINELQQMNARVRYIRDRNGNTLTYSYADGASDNPIKISDGLGREMNLTYGIPPGGSEKRLLSISDQGGRMVTFEYTGSAAGNNLLSVSDPLGNKTEFVYQKETYEDHDHYYVSGVKKPKGNTPYSQEYGYSMVNGTEAYRVAAQSDAYGNKIQFTYASEGGMQKTTVSYPDGSSEVIRHSSYRGMPVSLTDPSGEMATVSSNDKQQWTSHTNRLGNTTQLTYHEATGFPASTTDPKGNNTRFTYTAQDQSISNPATGEQATFTFYALSRIDYPDETSEQFTYGSKGNMLTLVDRLGKSWTYTYNDMGQVLTETNPVGGIISNTYHSDGMLGSSTDSDTGLTLFEYDTLSRLTKVTHPDGAAIRFTYDLNDLLTSRTDENGNTTTYTYDENGNLNAIIDPTGKNTQFSYDLLDRLTEITDTQGMKSTFTYDSTGRVIDTTDPNGNVVRYAYHENGWLIRITDGDGKIWQRGYDGEGIESSMKTPLGHITTYDTDAVGNVTAITDPLGYSTAFTFDSMSRMTSSTEPMERRSTYAYDRLGLLTSITRPKIGTVTFQKNDLGVLSGITGFNDETWTFASTSMARLSSIKDPLGNTWSYSYDQRGRVIQVSYPTGETKSISYDAAGNLARELYSDGTDLRFSYDRLDRLISANDIGFSYDTEGRIINTRIGTTNFEASYDDGGRLTTVTYDNGVFAVTYTYDERDLLTGITDSLTGTQLNMSYDDDERLISLQRSNGITTTYTYDDAGRLTRIKDGILADQRFTLNQAGEVTQVSLTLPLEPAEEMAVSEDVFSYDEACQVKSAGYTYDARGRLISSPAYTFTWDGAGGLKGIGSVALAYNGLGDLSARSYDGETTAYYYNYAIAGDLIMAEKDGETGQSKRYYVLTPGGRVLYMIDVLHANRVYFYHSDRVGSTIFLTDSSGTITDSYAYTPGGKLLLHHGTNTQPFTFIGGHGVRQEGTAGLYHMGARFYDSTTMRFISRDPLMFDGGDINLYSYAMNNPVSIIDPTGTMSREELVTRLIITVKENPKTKKMIKSPKIRALLRVGSGLINYPLGILNALGFTNISVDLKRYTGPVQNALRGKDLCFNVAEAVKKAIEAAQKKGDLPSHIIAQETRTHTHTANLIWFINNAGKYEPVIVDWHQYRDVLFPTVWDPPAWYSRYSKYKSGLKANLRKLREKQKKYNPILPQPSAPSGSMIMRHRETFPRLD